MASIFLQGLTLANFRGIGPVPQFIAPFREINFLIGPNNAGKSTVLWFLSRYLNLDPNSRQRGWRRSFDPLDANITQNGASVSFGLAIEKESILKSAIAKTDARQGPNITAILNGFSNDSLIWLYPDDRESLRFKQIDAKIQRSLLRDENWNYLWRSLTQQNGGSLVEHWMPEALGRLANIAAPVYPPVTFVPAIREIGAKGAEFTDYSGSGLIDKLAELQNPPHDERSKRKKFELINEFLRSVTDSDDASIEVPHDRRYLLVHMGGKTLPMTSLGTGIHEVIMLASFCTLVENGIVCVEEPEIHLHPLLQRKFIRYLRDRTSNQYFIATHSASLIDSVRSSVFSVEHDAEGTKIRLAASPTERYEICRHLGYRASDLLQSNAVIWVEGPSDRIYLNHWIKGVSSDLVEGIDYSIMFYGGRLLSHLSANDPDVEEFISLRRLNRNIAIVIDSDKASSQAKINETKKRIVREFGDERSWVTAGREIENYVPAAMLSRALAKIYPAKFVRLANSDRFAHRLEFVAKGKKKANHDVDKVRVAKAICAKEADFSELDLRKRVEQLVRFIRQANHG